MKVPAVSVVLPVHNGAAHIEEAVRSILAQSLPDFELVICDDGSDDGTPALIASFASEDARIRTVCRATKSGVVGAMNWAVGEARAPLVAVAHADDISNSDRLAVQHALMAANRDCVLAGAPARAINWHGNEAHPPNLWRLIRPGAFAPFAHSSIMVRKAAFEATGGYHAGTEYWEDLHLYWRMAQLGRILVSTRPLTTYRYSRISIRSRDCSAGVEQALQAMYRSAETPLHGDGAREDAKLHPRIFVARNWSRLWAGERATGFGRLWREGRLRFDRTTLESLGFMALASVAPRPFRAALKATARLRNGLALRELRGKDAVEWDPHAGPAR